MYTARFHVSRGAPTTLRLKHSRIAMLPKLLPEIASGKSITTGTIACYCRSRPTKSVASTRSQLSGYLSEVDVKHPNEKAPVAAWEEEMVVASAFECKTPPSASAG